MDQLVPHYRPEENYDASSIWSYVRGKKRKTDQLSGLDFNHKPAQSMRFKRRLISQRRGFTPRRTGARRLRPFLKKKKGYVRRYKKKAFMGRRFDGNVAARAIETRKLFHYLAPQAILNSHIGIAPNNQFVFMPMGLMVAGTLPSNFVGTQIWLRGLKLKMAITGDSGWSGSYLFKISLYRTDVGKYYSIAGAWDAVFAASPAATNFVQMAYAGGTAQSALQAKWEEQVQWKDLDMTSGNTYTDAQVFKTPANPNGPTLLYSKEHMIVNRNGTSNNICQEVDVWIPLNKIHKFLDYGDTSNLTTAPNFGLNGDYVWHISYLNGADIPTASPAAFALNIDCTSIVYWKDP